ncbi:hypothetical protein [Streptomyces sp. NPDC047043]|uniref:hypothetical protein n=1 Tax=Streptomyces sp. NPDC047043 TaxID=3154497 RepID=UPI00340E49C0
MNETSGPQFHGPISGSQIAFGNERVDQRQYLGAGLSEETCSRLIAIMQQLLPALGDLNLSAEREATLRRDADEVVQQASSRRPDEGRLRTLVSRIRNTLVAVSAGAVTGMATGVGSSSAELAHTVVSDLYRVLP